MNNGDRTLNTQEMNAETSPHWAITGSANCLPVGTRIAEFEITGVIGEGGFGNVYLAFDHSLQRTVAIKEYMPVALASRGADDAVLVQAKRHKETFETGMNSFINEARLLAQFDHPALIKVYRFWEQNNTAYMAMRYYEGQTFKSIVARHPEIVTEAWLKPILKPILEALEVLYKIQILHRDISPDNIMIQPGGEAVLLDFGAARQILGGMNQALTVILKPGYAPVEQYAEDSDMKQGPWTDIYALSAVVYAAIVKKPPPTSVTRLIKDPIELLQNSPQPGFSKDFLAAVDKGMAVQPKDRPQSIAEFSKLLGIDFGPPQPATLPVAKLTGAQKKADAANKLASTAKNPHGAKNANARSKKVSNKGSWVLIVAGVLAASAGIYRMSHRDVEPSAVIENRPSATAIPESGEPAGAPSALNPAVSAAAPTAAPVQNINPDSTASVAESGQKNDGRKEQLDRSIHASAKLQSTNGAGVDAGKKSPLPAEKPMLQKPAIAARNGGTSVSIIEKSMPVATPGTDQSALDAPLPGPAAPPVTAAYRLSVRPWATVFVDGSMKGVSPPLKKLILSEGKHQIRLVNPNFPDHTVDVLVNNKRKFGSIDYEFSAH